jgi:hypothetical protein
MVVISLEYIGIGLVSVIIYFKPESRTKYAPVIFGGLATLPKFVNLIMLFFTTNVRNKP